MVDGTAMHFMLQAQPGSERISRRDVKSIYEATLTVLEEVEQYVTGADAKADWRWAEDYRVPLVATVNGLDHSTLERIAHTAQDAFDQAQNDSVSGSEVQLSDKAMKAIGRILKLLDHVDSITVESDGRARTTIESAKIVQAVGQRRRRVYSSIEGHLVTLSDRGTSIAGRVVEGGTGQPVWCHFPVELAEEVSGLFRRNIVVSGMVAYDAHGSPVTVIEIDSVEPRERDVSLASMVGAAPSLLGGRTVEEFIQAMRVND